MPVTTLDPKTALIVIDLQKGMAGAKGVNPMPAVFANAAALAAAFRERGLPVVLVNVAGAPASRTDHGQRARAAVPEAATELMSELNRQPSDHLVTKHTRGAFTDTGLEALLRGLGVTQVVLTGIATGSGVAVTAHQAYELGFNITFATDAITDVDAEAHTFHLTRLFPKIGETGATADILALLSKGA